MDDNEQKVNNNVANAQPPALIKKYKRTRPRHGPVSIFVAITPPGDLPAMPISTVIGASHYGITSYSVLSAHSMTLVPPHHSLHLSLSPPCFFLSFSVFSSHIYLIWADCTTTAIKRRDLAWLRHFQILTGRRNTMYDSRQKEDLIARNRVFGEGGVT